MQELDKQYDISWDGGKTTLRMSGKSVREAIKKGEIKRDTLLRGEDEAWIHTEGSIFAEEFSVNKSGEATRADRKKESWSPYLPHTRTSSFAKWSLFIISIVLMVGGFVTAEMFVDAGESIGGIRSVSGNTLDEAYYWRLGSYVYPAIAWVVRGLGVFCGTVLWEMGRKA